MRSPRHANTARRRRAPTVGNGAGLKLPSRMYEGSIARVGLALWGTESVQAIAEHARAAEAAVLTRN